MKEKELSNWNLKKQNDREIPYTFKINQSKWGLKRHHMNPQFMYAIPINSIAKRFNNGEGFSGTWFSIKNNKLHATKAPDVWVGRP